MSAPPLGMLPPLVRSPLPGERAAAMIETLAATECPSFTTRRARRAERSGAPHDPIVWAEARGANVVDADGNRFVDMTSGFGVAAVGHAHPRVVAAACAQMARLPHALGDVHPSDVKIRLLTRLAALAPWPDARVVLGLSGSDAVEAALKTAMIATRRPGIVAFEGGYHGLAHGPLAACGFSDAFRAPFRAQLNPHVAFAPFPRRDASVADAMAAIERAWPDDPPGALLVEPIQGRGGVNVPPKGFLPELFGFARARGAIVIADEVLIGLGRTGARWRCIAEGATPDILCAGKALGGGLPVSACLGRADVMAAWGDPSGAAIHTGTFFGHPVGSAAALVALDVIDDEHLTTRAAETGAHLVASLGELAARSSSVREVRGAGLLVGVELRDESLALRVARGLLERGFIVLPAGRDAQVIEISPPLAIERLLLDAFVAALGEVIAAAERAA